MIIRSVISYKILTILVISSSLQSTSQLNKFLLSGIQFLFQEFIFLVLHVKLHKASLLRHFFCLLSLPLCIEASFEPRVLILCLNLNSLLVLLNCLLSLKILNSPKIFMLSFLILKILLSPKYSTEPLTSLLILSRL